tara:strand:+ start:1858 stop:3072 length:1215 start_codon:yes stop_codon:yes gene_type:complete
MIEIKSYNKYLHYRKGQLEIEKIRLVNLVKKYGSPLFCYSVNQLKDNYYELKKSFKKIKPLICYAVKANFNPKVLQIISDLGLGADVVSMGELKCSLKSGIDNDKIVFSGVGKTDEEIKFALKKNIKQINVESEEELKEIEIQSKNLKKKPNITLRLNPNVDAKTLDKISTGRLEDKFGIDQKKVIKIFQRYKDNEFLNVNGLSIHIGSQICELEPFNNAFKKLRNLIIFLREKKIFIKTIDLGGGIGIVYNKNKDKLFNISEYANIVEKNFAELDLEIILEPGRSLVGSSGILISKVIRTKKGNKKEFLIIDAGMNNLIRPSLYNASHKILPLKFSKLKKKYEVVGPICETSDIFSKNQVLSELRKDDYLIICSVGAYGSSMSSNYNLREPAKEILVDGLKIV